MDSQVRPVRSQGRPAQGPVTKPIRRKKRLSKLQLLVVAGLALLLVGGAVYYSFFLPSQVNKDDYQAVFLTNGQVYFGNLHDFGGSQPYMTDVYYFPPAGEGQTQEEAGRTLVKLGEEIHRPKDKIIFNREAILFVENLSDESSVVKAIVDNQ